MLKRLLTEERENTDSNSGNALDYLSQSYLQRRGHRSRTAVTHENPGPAQHAVGAGHE